jgi:hypothetical protein
MVLSLWEPGGGSWRICSHRTEVFKCTAHLLNWGCGGAATIVDVVTSAALITVSERGGVSLTMSIDYLNPGRLGEEVEVDARVCLPKRIPNPTRPLNLTAMSSLADGAADP